MIDNQALKSFIESRLADTDYFLTDLTVSAANEIVVEVDHPEAVDIDFCIELTRAIEQAFPRDEEDYSLEVGSAGITSPLKVAAQFAKNVGREVELLTCDGRKLKGILDSADADGFAVGVETKVRKEGAKRPVTETVSHEFRYADVKWVKPVLKF